LETFFCGGRKTGESREKSSEQGNNQQQTQPTYMYAPGWNRTQANTLTITALQASSVALTTFYYDDLTYNMIRVSLQ